MEVVHDLQLRLHRQFRVSESLTGNNYGCKLVAVSSTYGFAVIVGTEGKIYTISTATLQSVPSDNTKECEDFAHRAFLFHDNNAKIFAIDFNADGRVLAVAVDTPNGPFVHFFDATTFSPDFLQQPFPLNSERVTTDSAAVFTAFEWNPAIPEVFAAGTTEKLTVASFNIENPSKITSVGTTTLKASVNSLSWSPKGKQITAGDCEGRIYQLKPELQVVRIVEPPANIPALGVGPYRCAGICWISTTEWVVTFATNQSNNLQLMLLTIKKNQPPQWDNWSILPPVMNPTASKSIRFLPVFDWNLILLSSSCLSDVPVIGAVNNVWKPWELTEPFLINTPMAKGKDTFVFGTSLDLTPTQNIVVGNDGSAVPPQPIVYVYTSDGLLLLYHLASLNPARPSLVKPVQQINPSAIKNGLAPLNYKHQEQCLPGPSSGIRKRDTSGGNKLASPGPTPAEIQARKEAEAAKVAAEAKRVADAAAAKAEEERVAAAKKAEAERLAAVAKAEAEKLAAAKAEAERKAAEEAAIAKKKQDLAKAHTAFKQVFDRVVTKINEYGTLTTQLSTLRRGLEIGIQEDLNFEKSVEPLFKSAAHVDVIASEIDDQLQRSRSIVNAVNAAAKEAKVLLSHEKPELPAADWVFELSDDIDALEQRYFESVERFFDTEVVLRDLSKSLKDGTLHIQQPATLTEQEQNYVNRDSMTISRYINELSKRLSALRKTTRQLYSNDKIRKTRDALGENGTLSESLLEQSSFLDQTTSSQVHSKTNYLNGTPELMSALCLNDSDFPANPKRRTVLNAARASKMATLITSLENTAPPQSIHVNIVPVSDIVAKPEPKVEEITRVSVPNPKSVESRKALNDSLQALRIPRKKLEPISAPVTPRTLLNSNQLLQSVAPPAPVVVPAVAKPEPPSGISNLFGNKSSLFGNLVTSVTPEKPKIELKKVEPVLPKPEVVTTPIKPKIEEQPTKIEPIPPVSVESSTKSDAVSEPPSVAPSTVESVVSVTPPVEEVPKPAPEVPAVTTPTTTPVASRLLFKPPVAAEKPVTTIASSVPDTTTTPTPTTTTTPTTTFSFKPNATVSPVVTTASTTAASEPPIVFSFKPKPETTPTTEQPAAPATNAFGQPVATTASAVNFSFKPSTPTVAPTTTNAFGAPTTGSAFGGTGFGAKSAFGGGSTTTASTFGNAPATETKSAFGGGTNSSIFGGTAATTGTSAFGGTGSTTGTSAFGGTGAATGTSAFGGSTAPSTGSAFGGSSFSFKPKETPAPTNTSGGFGSFGSPLAANTATTTAARSGDDDGMEDDSGTNATANAFGSFGLGCAPNPANTSKNPFGTAPNRDTSNNFMFNKTQAPSQQNFFTGANPAVSAFGGSGSNTSAFGGGTTTSAFGGSGKPAFGAGSGTSAFGGNSGTSAFGGNSGTSAFGGSGITFGGPALNKSAFGGRSPFSNALPFAQTPNKPSSTFGSNAAPVTNGFAAFANKTGGFGALAQQSTQNSFGATSSFSQQPKTNNSFNTWRS